MPMNLAEMLREVILSMEQPATWERLVAAGGFLVSLDMVRMGIRYLALRAHPNTSDNCGSWKIAYPAFLWPVDFFVSSPIIPRSEFLAAFQCALEWFVVVS
jgi:hypothetical protein